MPSESNGSAGSIPAASTNNPLIGQGSSNPVATETAPNCHAYGTSMARSTDPIPVAPITEGQRVAHTDCYCYLCNVGKVTKSGMPYTIAVFIICPRCGNKRCPKATDHKLSCTNSNEPGQPGSRYV